MMRTRRTGTSAGARTRRAFLAACALAVSVAGAAGGAAPSFALAPASLAGATAVNILDANRDGKPDLVTLRADADELRVLLGDGAGAFAAGPPITTGHGPVAVATADFNRDGNSDLAVANDGSRNVGIVLGDGRGGFVAASGSPIPLDGSPGRLLAPDIDADGDPDLVVPVFNSKVWQVEIMLGDGSGRFAPAPSGTVARRSPYGSDVVGTGDFNGDRELDLAVGNTETKGVLILRGNGAGGFRLTQTVATRLHGGALATADFNGDGRSDLAVASSYSNAVAFLSGTSSGLRPNRGSPLQIAGYPHTIVAAGVDGDGRPDVAVGNGESVTLLLGNGRGGFHEAAYSPFSTRSSSGLVGVADFDGNGEGDLLTSGPSILFRTAADPSPKAARVRSRAIFRTARITLLAADGARVAAVTTRKHGCGDILVWTAPGRHVTRLRPGDLGCSGDGVFELAIGGGRVAWIEEGGGNNLEMTVMAAPLRGGRTKQLDYQVNGDRAGGDPTGGWVGHLVGAGSVLAYNRWTQVCDRPADYTCGDGDPLLHMTGERLVRITAGRPAVLATGPSAFALAAAGGSRFAVARADGVASVTAAGATLAFVADPQSAVRAVGLSASTLALERTFTLDLYNPSTGAVLRSIPLGPAAALQLDGVSDKYALLRNPRRVLLVRLRDGAMTSLMLPSGVIRSLVGARLTDAGLFYAYNLKRGADPGRVVFVATRALAAAF